jgi:hypothetical protein
MSDRPRVPPPRVRRLLDVEPLPAPPPLKLRGFLECFDRGSGLSALILEGRIGAQGLEVSIDGGTAISLPGEAGSDAHGAFVWMVAQEHAVGPQHALRIEADAHDVDVSLAAVSYLELPSDRVAQAELDYASRWYSVYFNALGLVDGCGSGGPRSLFPAASVTKQPN